MLRKERHREILNILEKEGKVVAKELSIMWDVSEDTIRRDLREMDSLGLLKRVHGGAFPASSGPITFSERTEENIDEKKELAQKGVKLIKDGQVLLLDGGSTSNLFLAQEIPYDFKGTIITNSPSISLTLSKHPNVEVMLLGGTFFKESLVTVGLDVVDTLKKIRADLCFLGVYSLHPDFGISIPHLQESYVKRQMINSSNKIASLVTRSKLNTISNYLVGPVSVLDYMITEEGSHSYNYNKYKELDIEII
ncbi:DeoR/GlpR family DNA-binding transcription regulator [Neobacillus bataviensis]|uniref:DeoR/GlpR family DNA-binding transcription regulator n=1 Tax=Neobacillus bataviensis TaxID=220685 RepID=UPI001CBCC05C|nr:DeoR/GlpR family DNA-binding transcription regulator [Neobacillus bataviensis]